MSARAKPEGDFQVTLVRWLRAVLPRGSRVQAVKNEIGGGFKNPQVAMQVQQRRKAEGVLPGASDLTLLIPTGITVLMEVKAPGEGRLDADQQDYERDVTAIGHHYGVADSIETARWVLQHAGVALREPAGQPAWPWDGYRVKRKPSLDQVIPF